MSKNTDHIIRLLPTGYLSVSQINCFLQCGYKYFYRYVLRQKTAAGLALVFGKAGHHVLEENSRYYLDTGINLSPSELTSLFNSYFDQHKSSIDNWNGLNSKLVKSSASSLLSLFHSTYINMFTPYNGGIEKKVQLEVAGIPMLGYIDFVGMFNSSETVLDYKFVSRAKSRKDVDEDIQLTFYSMATNIPSVRFVSFIKPHPRYNPKPKIQVISSIRGDKDFERFTGLVSDVASKIAQRSFSPARKGDYLCSENYCDFWNQCPSGGNSSARIPSKEFENSELAKSQSLEEILSE